MSMAGTVGRPRERRSAKSPRTSRKAASRGDTSCHQIWPLTSTFAVILRSAQGLDSALQAAGLSGPRVFPIRWSARTAEGGHPGRAQCRGGKVMLRGDESNSAQPRGSSGIGTYASQEGATPSDQLGGRVCPDLETVRASDDGRSGHVQEACTARPVRRHCRHRTQRLVRPVAGRLRQPPLDAARRSAVPMRRRSGSARLCLRRRLHNVAPPPHDAD
jgi:hypothetical protein